MDQEKLRRRQSLKIIISEALMVLAVVATVTVLAFIVSGYWLNSDFEIERHGLLQISSVPTGADVEIDGNSSWFQKTNTSKVLPSGEHTVIITKDGYDSWSKTINISEGLLYRIHYPRLFLQDRFTEKAYTVSPASYATISPSRDTLLLANDTTKWTIIELDKEKIEPRTIDIAGYFSATSIPEGSTTGIFSGKILSADWDKDGTHILFKTESGSNINWSLIDINNTTNSINIDQEFNSSFDSIEILDDSSNNLLVLQDGNLRKIDVSGKVISAVLASNVTSFDHYNNEIVYSSKQEAPDGTTSYSINSMKIGDQDIDVLETLPTPARVLISRFYDEKYITTLVDTTATLYNKNDFVELESFDLSFVPEHLKVGHNGEFIVMYTGNTIATLDMEAMKLTEWQTEGSSFGWIDNDMIYTVADGTLIVYDFDGLNRRAIAENVSDRFPATITDDKWLYYFSGDALMREWLIAR